MDVPQLLTNLNIKSSTVRTSSLHFAHCLCPLYFTTRKKWPMIASTIGRGSHNLLLPWILHRGPVISIVLAKERESGQLELTPLLSQELGWARVNVVAMNTEVLLPRCYWIYHFLRLNSMTTVKPPRRGQFGSSNKIEPFCPLLRGCPLSEVINVLFAVQK